MMKKHSLYLLQLTFAFMALLVVGDGMAQPFVEVINKGIPGNSSADLLARVSGDVIELEPDLVLVLVGTNDLLNTQKMVSIGDYYRHLDLLTDSLLKNGISIALVSPPTVDTLYLFERHDPSRYPDSPMNMLAAARDTLRALCKQKDLLFIDLFAYLNEMEIPIHEKDQIIRNRKNSDSNDGVHFTKDGNELLGSMIYGQLQKYFGKLNQLKIICFGDSITYGVYMQGKGTAEGDTYPAVLKRLILKEI